MPQLIASSRLAIKTACSPYHQNYEEREAREKSALPQAGTNVTKARREHEAHRLGGRTSGGKTGENFFGPGIR